MLYRASKVDFYFIIYALWPEMPQFLFTLAILLGTVVQLLISNQPTTLQHHDPNSKI